MSIIIELTDATYLSEYRILVKFSDENERIVDFEEFLTKHSHPQFNKYRQPAQFKKFKIERGNLVWGKDWDLIFPVEQLYSGKIDSIL
ncbi:hypothetical protein DYBT9623_03437 [Dyadobacter sp. CECT 9623]|uniref:DUF2442 domain-containing protein n=1 Tax=Dyadobacter linearis TaxID=2823330 RepID=A0ABM8UT12_9BACT|nr:DUF2442 domain-containing protein [Dyadobacter sp. CECT 9623]CAG5071408.1 hypothetical protein DYBT9623_03437 [Dyadobacter sp. CECT 9623]